MGSQWVTFPVRRSGGGLFPQPVIQAFHHPETTMTNGLIVAGLGYIGSNQEQIIQGGVLLIAQHAQR